MAAAAAMEDLLPAWAKPRDDVLEVGHRSSGTAEHGGIERPADGGEQPQRDQAAADLEAAVRDVLVRHAVAGDVQRRPEQKRERPRAKGRAEGCARGHVQRDDHQEIFAPRAASVYAPAMSWLKRLFSSTPTTSGDTDKPTGEETIMRDDGEADLGEMEYLSGGAGVPGVAAPEAAETAEAELSEYEKPTDLAP